MKLEDIQTIFDNTDLIEAKSVIKSPEMKKILKAAKIRLKNDKTTAIIFEHLNSSLFQAISNLDGSDQQSKSYQKFSAIDDTNLTHIERWSQLDKTDFIVVRDDMLKNAERFLKEEFPDIVIVVINQLKDIDSIEVRNLLNYCSNNTLMSPIYVVLNDAQDLECVEKDQCMLCYPEVRKRLLNDILPRTVTVQRIFKVSATKRIAFENNETDEEYLESFLNDNFESLEQHIRKDLDAEFRKNRCIDAIMESEKLLTTLNALKEKEEETKENMQHVTIVIDENADFCVKEVKEKSSKDLYDDLEKIFIDDNKSAWKAEIEVKVENKITKIGPNLVDVVKEKLEGISNSNYALSLYLKDHFKPVELTKNCLDDCFSEDPTDIPNIGVLDQINTSFRKTVDIAGNAFKSFASQLVTIVDKKFTQLKSSLESMYKGTSEDFAKGIIEYLQTRDVIKESKPLDTKKQEFFKFIGEFKDVDIYNSYLSVNSEMGLSIFELDSIKSDIVQHIDRQFIGMENTPFGQLKEQLFGIIQSKATVMQNDLSRIGIEIKKEKYYRDEFPIIRRMSLKPDPTLIDYAKSVLKYWNPPKPIERRKSTSEMIQDKSPKRFIKESEMKQMVTDIFECLSIMPSVIEEICQCVDSFFRNMQN